MRRALLSAARLAGLGLLATAELAPAAAQWNGPLWVGVPQHLSTETGAGFFFAADAQAVDRIARTMADAAARCDRTQYEQAQASAGTLKANIEAEAQRTTNQYEPLQYRKDAQAVGPALEKVPRLPAGCTPTGTVPSAVTGGAAPLKDYAEFGLVQVYAVGGVLARIGAVGNVTGVDVAGPGSVVGSTGGTGTTVGMAGGRVRAELPFARESGTPSAFFEAGVQSSFGSQSFIQTFGQIGPRAQGYGSSTVTENLQIPLLAGISLPFTEITGVNPVYLELYGGITLDSWTQTLQGAEWGAPAGGPGFFSQAQRFTVDPTAGAGVRVPLSVGAGGFPLILRAGAEFQFRPGGVVLAQSGQFGSQAYWGTVNPTVNGLFFAGVGIPFGK
ncbi:MAG: hypothetical protein JOY64_32280 [Alphaproteobacteria bacterium]|nr:hypothetical protein [Alphaproteobacteria bacterium]MBV8412338.1 hypothetical protein [Alphaproteobacteria bacterium]